MLVEVVHARLHPDRRGQHQRRAVGRERVHGLFLVGWLVVEQLVSGEDHLVVGRKVLVQIRHAPIHKSVEGIDAGHIDAGLHLLVHRLVGVQALHKGLLAEYWGPVVRLVDLLEVVIRLHVLQAWLRCLRLLLHLELLTGLNQIVLVDGLLHEGRLVVGHLQIGRVGGGIGLHLLGEGALIDLALLHVLLLNDVQEQLDRQEVDGLVVEIDEREFQFVELLLVFQLGNILHLQLQLLVDQLVIHLLLVLLLLLLLVDDGREIRLSGRRLVRVGQRKRSPEDLARVLHQEGLRLCGCLLVRVGQVRGRFLLILVEV